MAFHPEYFDVASSRTRRTSTTTTSGTPSTGPSASSNIGTESRPLPGPTGEVDISDPLILVTPVGGVIEFSGQHLHSSVPNQTGRTRFSIDFRTVHVGDIVAGRSATNVDADCTGSSIRDFMRATDFSPMPAEIVDQFVDGTEDRGDLVYAEPSTAD